MTRGRVDLKLVADRLSLVDAYLVRLRQLPADRDAFFADPRNVDSTESLVRRALEALHCEEVTDAELFGIRSERLADVEAVRLQLAEAAAALAGESM